MIYAMVKFYSTRTDEKVEMNIVGEYCSHSKAYKLYSPTIVFHSFGFPFQFHCLFLVSLLQQNLDCITSKQRFNNKIPQKVYPIFHEHAILCSVCIRIEFLIETVLLYLVFIHIKQMFMAFMFNLQ